jgi:hypothetical protein
MNVGLDHLSDTLTGFVLVGRSRNWPQCARYHRVVDPSEGFDSRRLYPHALQTCGARQRSLKPGCAENKVVSCHRLTICLPSNRELRTFAGMRIGIGIRWLLLSEGVLCLVVASRIDAQLNRPAGAAAASDAVERTLKDAWVPPDIDSVHPSVAEKTTCALQDVVSRAGTNVEEFVDNLNRLSAIETIQSQTVSRSNILRNPEIQHFEYVVSAKRGADGNAYLDEYRDRNMDPIPQSSSDNVAVSGAFSALLIFHPYHSKDFQMTCLGLGTWHGQPAWQIRFEEQSHHMNAIVINHKQYLLTLRGRAWILANSYQVSRVETDLVNTIREIRLRLQHVVIEYSPHSFPRNNVEMWVPSSAEFYMDFRGHRFYRRHSYTDFQLFLVKVHQEFGQIR